MTFTALQVAWAEGPLVQEAEAPDPLVAETSIESSTPFPESPELFPTETSTEFLADEKTLQPVIATLEEPKPSDFSYDPHDFGAALEEVFSPDVAGAAVLKNPLSREELELLNNRAMEKGKEYAGAVLWGQTVLVGGKEEITAAPGAREELAKASFLWHIHVDKHAHEGPTGPDLLAVAESQNANRHVSEAFPVIC